MNLTSDDAMEAIDAVLEKVRADDVEDCLAMLKDRIAEIEADRHGDEYEAAVNEIRGYLQTKVPIDGMAPGEKTSLPQAGAFKGDNEANSVHVDSYIFDDDTLDALADEGKFSHHYCAACGSKDVKLLEFHSHSLPPDGARFVFTELLSAEERKGKKFVDVGSRTGAILYSAALYGSELLCPKTMAPKAAGENAFASITGVEMNPFFCDVQRTTLKRFKIKGVQVVEGDALSVEGLGLLKEADIVMFNNVFQFFSTEEEQRKAWTTVSKTLRKGTIVVSVPALEEALELVGMSNTWAKKIPFDCNHCEYSSLIHKYLVQ